jgi:Protein of unknwon function (DUF3310)
MSHLPHNIAMAPNLQNPSTPAKPVATGADARQVGGNHYKDGRIQPWDAMEDWLTPTEFIGFLKGSLIKYLARSNKKGGVEDLLKAEHYQQKLLEVLRKYERLDTK